MELYHYCPVPLENGSVITPGNWGASYVSILCRTIAMPLSSRNFFWRTFVYVYIPVIQVDLIVLMSALVKRVQKNLKAEGNFIFVTM